MFDQYIIFIERNYIADHDLLDKSQVQFQLDIRFGLCLDSRLHSIL